MTGIARIGIDTVGGAPIIGGGQSTFFVDGQLAAVKGDPVTPHGAPPHSSPTMVESSADMFIEGKGVCRQGDSATCGHTATGSSDAFAD